MPRELGQVIGRCSGRRRAGLAASLVVLGLTASACLVTDNSDLPTPTDIPDVRPSSPPTFSQVTTVGDPDCLNNSTEPSTLFEVSVRYADTQTDDVYLQLYFGSANTPLYFSPVQLRHNGTPVRTPLNELCVANSKLSDPCNHVWVAVSTNFDKFRTLPSPDDPDVFVRDWYLFPSVVVDPNRDPNACVELSMADGVR